MVVTLQAVAHQSHHNLVSEVQGSVLVVVVPAEVSTEPIGGIAEAPKLDPPLHGLPRHVLLPAQTTVELYHRLVDRHIARRLVALAKVLLAKGNQRADLRKLIIPVLIPWHRTVEVLAEFLIPCARQYSRDESVVREWLIQPVVLIARKVLDAHGDVDADVCLDLIGSRRMPEWISSFKLEMRSISAGGGDFATALRFVASATLSKKSMPNTCSKKRIGSVPGGSRVAGPVVWLNGSMFGGSTSAVLCQPGSTAAH